MKQILGCVVGAISLCLAGCAGSVIESAMNPQAVAAREDAYCQSIGAAPGSPGYTDCRLQLNSQRQANHRSAIAEATYIAGQSMAQSQQRVVNCRSSMLVPQQVNTTCY